MKFFIFFFFIFFADYLFAEDLSTFENKCTEIGFKPKTVEYGDCVLELRSRFIKKNNSDISKKIMRQPIKKTNEIGDGSNNDTICQKYGFKVSEEGYKKCRLDLDIAEKQAEADLMQYEEQKRQYDEQKRVYEQQVQAEHDRKETEAGINLLMYGLGIAGGRTPDQAAPALYGLPMYPRQPPQPPVVNIIPPISRPGQYMQCTYNSITRLMQCN